MIVTANNYHINIRSEPLYLTPSRKTLMIHVIVKTIMNDMNHVVVVVLFLVLEVYDLHLEYLIYI